MGLCGANIVPFGIMPLPSQSCSRQSLHFERTALAEPHKRY